MKDKLEIEEDSIRTYFIDLNQQEKLGVCKTAAKTVIVRRDGMMFNSETIHENIFRIRKKDYRNMPPEDLKIAILKYCNQQGILARKS